ncbi:hypothetical protein ACHWQZ_G017173 [Mnemiopsis leidyi]
MIFFMAFWTIGAASNSATQLNYHAQDHWEGVCTTGQAQSPIDIPAPSSKQYVTGNFLDLPKNSFMMNNLNNPNTAKYAVENEKIEATVPWSGNRKVTLLQLHLHWGASNAQGSEHLIKGKAYAAEAHLVTSYIADDGSTKYMVFARVFKLGRENHFIKQMMAGEMNSGQNRNIASFSLGQLYPANTGDRNMDALPRNWRNTQNLNGRRSKLFLRSG